MKQVLCVLATLTAAFGGLVVAGCLIVLFWGLREVFCGERKSKEQSMTDEGAEHGGRGTHR